ncbi:hypothetical protein SCHPADRAFT_598383 [Schizopora paradoxa]|uniref:F-box domain-containing protein n=1 Tax=Schizopora paradoxa TaxID=27342 RepID=A0A0H2RA49_9AGAM|nr:hypothetical protein SCHPADRAFT_598383 [Schizopora paradoxa]
MAAIVDLVDDTLCDIFSLTIQNTRVYPSIFTTGNNFQDCVSLIDISRVCRRWREVALTDSSLWSSIYILLDNPTAKTLRQATCFASICLARSKDLPLTCAISITDFKNLDHLPFAYPLVQTLISHEARWSQIAFNLTPSPGFRSSKSSAKSISKSGYSSPLRTAGAGLLKEFQFSPGPWLTYSMAEPLPAMESLKTTSYKVYGCMYTLMKWLPLTPNLSELELRMGDEYFHAYIAKQDEEFWMAAAQETEVRPHFVLPNLRTLTIWPTLFPYLTCPALEKYVIERSSSRHQDVTNYFDFIKRSGTPSSFRTIEIRKQDDELYIADVQDYFLPTITNFSITSPGKNFYETFSERSPDGNGFRLLPMLEHLEITDCADVRLPLLSSILTSRWDIRVPQRTLKSVKLNRRFTISSIPEILLSPPSKGIDVTQVGEDWREIARCVNEGLSLSA